MRDRLVRLFVLAVLAGGPLPAGDGIDAEDGTIRWTHRYSYLGMGMSGNVLLAFRPE